MVRYSRSRVLRRFFVTIAMVTGFQTDCMAQDKDRYSVFNPTPKESMREFVTDRPDKTEAPITVDAGHFQHETDLLNVSIDQAGGDTDVSYLAFAPNLKLGLTNYMDIQFVIESFTYSQSAGRKVSSGNGDLTTRLKINLWGNDGGSSALALMPYVKAPINSGNVGNNDVEGGLIVPLAISLTETIALGLMTQYDLVSDPLGRGYKVQFVNSATIGTDLFDDIGGYVELWTAAMTNATPEVTFDVGLTYAYDNNTRLDIGLNTGLSDAADDFNPFIGLSQRF